MCYEICDLQGRVNSQQGTLEITSWKSRDVTDEELIKIREKLSDWIDHCASVADNLRAIASNAENAIAEANVNEAKVVNCFIFFKRRALQSEL